MSAQDGGPAFPSDMLIKGSVKGDMLMSGSVIKGSEPYCGMSGQDGGPAYPQSDVLYEDGCELVRTQHGGMSLRQYAAINLRVPDSGTDWLDAMILQSKRDDFAGQALAGMMSNCDDTGLPSWLPDPAARNAYTIADAMIAARSSK